MTFELPFLALCLLVVTPWGRGLISTEEQRVERERVAPARRETPEHFEAIEKDMAGIRSRMLPVISDLRKHAEPRALKDQVSKDLQGHLRGSLETSRIASVAQAARSPRRLAALGALAVAVVLAARRANDGSDR